MTCETCLPLICLALLRELRICSGPGTVTLSTRFITRFINLMLCLQPRGFLCLRSSSACCCAPFARLALPIHGFASDFPLLV